MNMIKEYLRRKKSSTVDLDLLANKLENVFNLEDVNSITKELLNSFDNNYHYATVAYNMGPYWTKTRLKKNLPVGKKNHYLNKVLKAYHHIAKNLNQNINVTFIPHI